MNIQTLNESYNSSFIKKLFNNTTTLKYCTNIRSLHHNSIYSYLKPYIGQDKDHSNYIINQIFVSIDMLYKEYLNLIDDREVRKLFIDNTNSSIEFKEYKKVDDLLSNYQFKDIDINKFAAYASNIIKEYKNLCNLLFKYKTGNFEISFDEIPEKLQPLFYVNDNDVIRVDVNDVRDKIQKSLIDETKYSEFDQYILFVKENNLSAFFYKKAGKEKFIRYFNDDLSNMNMFLSYKDVLSEAINNFKGNTNFYKRDAINIPLISYNNIEYVVDIIKKISYISPFFETTETESYDWKYHIYPKLYEYNVYYINVPVSIKSKFNNYDYNVDAKLQLPDTIQKEATFNYIQRHPFVRLFDIFYDDLTDSKLWYFYQGLSITKEVRLLRNTYMRDIQYSMPYTELVKHDNTFNFNKNLVNNLLYTNMSKAYSIVEKFHNFVKKSNNYTDQQIESNETKNTLQKFNDMFHKINSKFKQLMDLYDKTT